jgi:hypothetical protein
MYLWDAGLVFGILSIVAGILLAVLIAPRGPLGAGDDDSSATSEGPGVGAVAAAPTAAQARGVRFEKFERADPALPAIPPGEVKRFKVDVYEHVTKVAEELAPTGREHLLRAVEDVAVDSVAAGARLALAAPVLLRVRTPLAS